ncbi:hypothetical protein AGMMS50276_08350 [Synergistales bacterium]|nr:hypothetical protein AGMMS50276_08350 [Synergistales bacterium]
MEVLDIARWADDFPTRRGMSRDERMSLPNDAFIFAPHDPNIHIALVDDVVTTGSTLLSLSKAALAHGITVTRAFAVAFAS